jgi:hypothetical protein
MAKEAPQIGPPNKVIPPEIIDSISLNLFIITIFTKFVQRMFFLVLVACASLFLSLEQSSKQIL